MGNSSKKPGDYQVINTYKPEQWMRLQQKGEYEIWENKRTHQRAQAYTLHNKLTSDDLQKLEMRKNGNQDIVGVYNVAKDSNNNLCSKSDKAQLLVENMPLRLSNVHDLTENQSLLVLKSAYRGFNTLSTFYGPIQPYEDMICFNQSGTPKVWINSNLSHNHPEATRQADPLKNTNKDSRNEVYVRKLFDMVENKTINKQLPFDLKNKFREANYHSYFQALNGVEDYLFQKKVNLSPGINVHRDNAHNKFESSNVTSYQKNNILSHQSNSNGFYQHQRSNNQSLSMSNLHNINQQQFRSVQNLNISSHQSHQNNFIRNPAIPLPSPPQQIHQKPNSYRIVFPNPKISTQTIRPQEPIRLENSRSIGPQIRQHRIETSFIPRQQQIVRTNQQTKGSRVLSEINHLQVPPSKPVTVPVRPTFNYNQQIAITQPQSININRKFFSPSKVVFNEPIRIQQQPIQRSNPISLQSSQKAEHAVDRNIQNQQINQSSSIVIVTNNSNLTPQNVAHQIVQNHTQQQHYERKLQSLQRLKDDEHSSQNQNQENVDQNQGIENQQQYHEQVQQDDYNEENREQYHEEQIVIWANQSKNRNQSLQKSDNILGSVEGYERKSLNSQDSECKDVEEIDDKSYQDERQEQLEDEDNQYQYQQYQRVQINREQEKQTESKQIENKFSGKNQRENVITSFGGQTTFFTQNKPIQKPKQIQSDSEQPEIIPDRPQNNQRSQFHIYNDENSNSEYNSQNRIPERRDNYYREVCEQKNVEDRIPEDATSEQIEVYIRRKYQTYIGNSEPQDRYSNNYTRTYEYQSRPQYTSNNYGTSSYDYKYKTSERQQNSEFPNQYQGYSFRPTPTQMSNINQNNSGSYNFQEQTLSIPKQIEGLKNVVSKEQIVKNEYDYTQMGNYVESKYNKYKEEEIFAGQSNRESVERISDMLDVKSMERSLDKKYKSKANIKSNEFQEAKGQQEEFDVKKLEENLIKFQESRVGTANNNNKENKFAISEVEKVGSYDRIKHERKSSLKGNFGEFRQENSYTYILETGKKNYEDYSKGSDSSRYPPKSNKISKYLNSIDEKFSKYVTNPVQDNYSFKKSSNFDNFTHDFNSNSYKNIDSKVKGSSSNAYHNSSRMATGKFYDDNQYKSSGIYNSGKNQKLTYNGLRNFLWE